MTVYTIGLILPLLFYILVFAIEQFTKKSCAKIDESFSRILFIYYTFFTIFRGTSVGTDLHNYVRRYYLMSQYDFSSITVWHERWNFEYGFLFINKVLGYVNNSPQIFILVSGLFILATTHWAIKKYSLSPCLSYYFYVVFIFWATSLNLVRLFIAMSICLMSISCIKEKKLKRYIILVLAAALIHRSSIIFLILYPFCKVKINLRRIMLFFSGCAFVYILGKNLIGIAIRGFSSLYYEKYSDRIGSGSGNGMLLLLIFVFAVCYLNEIYGSKEGIKSSSNKMFEEKLSYNDIWLHMVLLAIAFNVVALKLEIAARMMWFFKLGLLFLIPNTFRFYNARRKGDIFLFLGFIMVCLILPVIYYHSSMVTDNFGIVPFVFFGNTLIAY